MLKLNYLFIMLAVSLRCCHRNWLKVSVPYILH